MKAWQIDRVIHFGPGGFLNSGFAHFGFHDRTGHYYGIAHPKHFLGAVDENGSVVWTLAAAPHPMIDGTLRKQRILAESNDPKMAILFLDFVLGYNASMDPVGELLDAITAAKQAALQRGGNLTVVASVCGTDGDPQDVDLQFKLLKHAGVIVFNSNAKAAQFCAALLRRQPLCNP